MTEYRTIGVLLSESDLQQAIREPLLGAKQVGAFEWWLEGEMLVIQSRISDQNCYPEICFSQGWGEASYIPMESDIRALFLYRTALEFAFAWDNREDKHLMPCCNEWIESSFTEVLERLKDKWKP